MESERIYTFKEFVNGTVLDEDFVGGEKLLVGKDRV